MQVISILGNSLCNLKICCFQVHFVNFIRSFHLTAIMLKTIPSFYTTMSEKSHFVSANTYKTYALFVQTTAPRITTTRRHFYRS